VKDALERDVGLIRCEDGRLEISLGPTAAKTLVHELSRKLTQWTSRPWTVVVSAEAGQPTVRSQLQARQAELTNGVRGDPLVQAVLNRFPGAEIVDVRKIGDAVEQSGGTDADPASPELRSEDEASA
jgi:DNA polymerase-3 subunit gamma/tau